MSLDLDPFKKYGIDVSSVLQTPEGQKELLFGPIEKAGLKFSTKTLSLGNVKMSGLHFEEYIPSGYEAFEEEG